jgi:amino acid permease
VAPTVITTKAVPAMQNDGSKSTMSKAIFNLVKGIVGAGVLSLPAGM